MTKVLSLENVCAICDELDKVLCHPGYSKDYKINFVKRATKNLRKLAENEKQ